ncbi:MAG: phage tail tape measure protein, partial [Gammaproteobacteria bacterium]|nr:phage tail tape measure protein [Gammaproteobacteria bacterium]
MSQTRQEVEDLVHVNDVLAKTATSSNTSISELGFAFGQIGSVGTAVGMSIEEISGSLAVLANNGYKGERAGVILRNTISGLINPTADAAARLEKLGVQVYDSSGSMNGFSDIIRQFEGTAWSATDALSIFGDRAGPGLLSLLSSGAEAIDRYTLSMKYADGAATQIQKDIDGGLGKAIADLSAKWDSLKGSIGEAVSMDVSAWLREMIQHIEDNKKAIVGLFENLFTATKAIVNAGIAAAKYINENKEFIVALAKAIVNAVIATAKYINENKELIAALIALGVIVKIVLFIKALIISLRTLAPAAGAARLAMMGLNAAFLASPMGWIVVIGLIVVELGKLLYALEPVEKAVDWVINKFKKWFGLTDKGSVSTQKLSDELAELTALSAKVVKLTEDSKDTALAIDAMQKAGLDLSKAIMALPSRFNDISTAVHALRGEGVAAD